MAPLSGNKILATSRRPGVLGRMACSLSFLLALFLAPRAAKSADEPTLEYQVKATFLLNYTKFTEWPPSAFASPTAPISICVLGEDPFNGALRQILEGETVGARRVVTQQIRQAPPLHTCQIIFLSGDQRENLKKLLPQFGPGVLTVGEGDGFLRAGGMIAFVIENRRVRFDIHQTAAENAGLKLSSKLLSVARSVEK
ncbi:MAG TPA: YfiR family protein [Bryobacteraceae bacterium]|jgi:hypothetical protein